MSGDIVNRLRAEFPELYEHTPSSSVRDGWYEILREMSLKIQDATKTNPPSDSERPKVYEIKEKFGQLRIHVFYSDSDVALAVSEAERRSAETCQDCGDFGSRVCVNGWWMTLCDRHVRDRQA